MQQYNGFVTYPGNEAIDLGSRTATFQHPACNDQYGGTCAIRNDDQGYSATKLCSENKDCGGVVCFGLKDNWNYCYLLGSSNIALKQSAFRPDFYNFFYFDAYLKEGQFAEVRGQNLTAQQLPDAGSNTFVNLPYNAVVSFGARTDTFWDLRCFWLTLGTCFLAPEEHAKALCAAREDCGGLVCRENNRGCFLTGKGKITLEQSTNQHGFIKVGQVAVVRGTTTTVGVTATATPTPTPTIDPVTTNTFEPTTTFGPIPTGVPLPLNFSPYLFFYPGLAAYIDGSTKFVDPACWYIFKDTCKMKNYEEARALCLQRSECGGFQCFDDCELFGVGHVEFDKSLQNSEGRNMHDSWIKDNMNVTIIGVNQIIDNPSVPLPSSEFFKFEGNSIVSFGFNTEIFTNHECVSTDAVSGTCVAPSEESAKDLCNRKYLCGGYVCDSTSCTLFGRRAVTLAESAKGADGAYLQNAWLKEGVRATVRGQIVIGGQNRA
ncbi:hypothetical protein HDU97_009400, partial [Phlyctochytrium planicorne]